MTKEERIKHARDFLDTLFQHVNTMKFACLCAGTNGYYPDNFYDVSIPQQRQKMAERAITLNDKGQNIALNINLMDKIPPKKDDGKLARGKAEDITTQIAIISDIDTEGGRHTSTEGHVYTPDTETAINYAPIPPTLIVDSGYGVHFYNILAKPLELTTIEQRNDTVNTRNRPYIEIIRERANKSGYNTGIDSVFNLDRVLRMPGTFNYSNDRDHPPLCKVIEENEIQYSTEEFDNKIKTFITPEKLKTDKPNDTPSPHSLEYGQNADFDLYRASRMLDYIDSYDELIWTRVCAYLRNIAQSGAISKNDAFNLFNEWSAKNPDKYNKPDKKGNSGATACLDKWENSTMGGDWGNLSKEAEKGGYNAHDVTREFYEIQYKKNFKEKEKKVKEMLKESKEKRQSAQVEEESNDNPLIGDLYGESLLNDFDQDVETRREYASRKTGFSSLDEKQIFAPGVYAVTAPPAEGKTTFAHQLTMQIATLNSNESVVFVSYEMSKHELNCKQLARTLKQTIDQRKLENQEARKQGKTPPYSNIGYPMSSTQISIGGTNATFKEMLEEERKKRVNFRTYEARGVDIDTLIKQLRKHIEAQKALQNVRSPIVVLDYLGVIPHNNESHRLGIDSIVNKLKTFQRETNTTFIVISAMNRQSYKGNADSVQMDSFKESGGIEYTADVAWALKRTGAGGVAPRQVTLKCLKNRFGSNDYHINFDYWSEFDLFVESENQNSIESHTQSKKYNDIN